MLPKFFLLSKYIEIYIFQRTEVCIERCCHVIIDTVSLKENLLVR